MLDGLLFFVRPAIPAIVLVSFVALSALFFIWLERKVSARIHDRLGPTRVGKFGLLQTLADGIKLLAKEDFIPPQADQLLFRMGPYLAFLGAFLPFVILPFGYGLAPIETGVSVFLLLALMSLEVFGVILAGYASGNKWSLFGAIRESAQMVSYEVPRTLCVVIVLMAAGTMNLADIARQQTGFFWNWFIFRDPFLFITFWVFFTCGVAGCKRAPFDLAEAESELVAGFHTEYSGLRWSLFFMAEYGSMFVISGVACVLFLGGWQTGLLPNDPVSWLGFVGGNIVNVIIFILKCWILVFIMMWVRWTLPRLRIDQVMTTCLKYLVPICCFCLIGSALWPLLWNTLLPGWFQWRQPAGIPVRVELAPLSPPGRGVGGEGASSRVEPLLKHGLIQNNPSSLTLLPGGEKRTRQMQEVCQSEVSR
jgi:NADH-quinone oxidoreductase subunit H